MSNGDMGKGVRYIDTDLCVGLDGSTKVVSVDEFMLRLPVSMRVRFSDVSVGMDVLVYDKTRVEVRLVEGKWCETKVPGSWKKARVTGILKTVYKTDTGHSFNSIGLCSRYHMDAICFRPDSEAKGLYCLYSLLSRTLEKFGTIGKATGLNPDYLSNFMAVVVPDYYVIRNDK